MAVRTNGSPEPIPKLTNQAFGTVISVHDHYAVVASKAASGYTTGPAGLLKASGGLWPLSLPFDPALDTAPSSAPNVQDGSGALSLVETRFTVDAFLLV